MSLRKSAKSSDLRSLKTICISNDDPKAKSYPKQLHAGSPSIIKGPDHHPRRHHPEQCSERRQRTKSETVVTISQQSVRKLHREKYDDLKITCSRGRPTKSEAGISQQPVKSHRDKYDDREIIEPPTTSPANMSITLAAAENLLLPPQEKRQWDYSVQILGDGITAVEYVSIALNSSCASIYKGDDANHPIRKFVADLTFLVAQGFCALEIYYPSYEVIEEYFKQEAKEAEEEEEGTLLVREWSEGDVKWGRTLIDHYSKLGIRYEKLLIAAEGEHSGPNNKPNKNPKQVYFNALYQNPDTMGFQNELTGWILNMKQLQEEVIRKSLLSSSIGGESMKQLQQEVIRKCLLSSSIGGESRRRHRRQSPSFDNHSLDPRRGKPLLGLLS